MNKRRRRSESREGIREAVSAGLIGIFILSVLAATMAVPAVLGGEDPVLPHRFYGNVTVNGEPAPVGTIVTGRIVDPVEGSFGEGNWTVNETGKYGDPARHDYLLVVTDDYDNEGKTIEFYVKLLSGGEGKANETEIYVPANETKRDLTVTTGAPPVLTTITVSPPSVTLKVNDTQQFTATAYNNSEEMSGVTFAWSVSNGTVGIVNETGFFEAKALGDTLVNATAEGVTGSAEVTVTKWWIGDMNGDGNVTFDDAVYLARHVLAGDMGPELYPLHDDGNVDSINDVNFDDAVYLARHILAGDMGPELYPLYP